MRSLQLHRMPQQVIDMVMKLYSGASTMVRIPGGYMVSILLIARVKQDNPLSPILFNLAMELLNRAVQNGASECGWVQGYGTPEQGIVQMKTDMPRIDKCLLAPRQKLHAARSFVHSTSLSSY